MKAKDLEHLTNEQLRSFFTDEDIENLPQPILDFVKDGKETRSMGERLNRVERLINIIVVDRFVDGKLK